MRLVVSFILYAIIMLGTMVGGVAAQAPFDTPDRVHQYYPDDPVTGEGRHYIVYVPAAAYSGAPIVILLHGSGGTPRDILTSSGMWKGADYVGALILVPDVRVRGVTHPGWSKKDVPFIREAIYSTADEFDADTSQVYAAGFSLGSYMCWVLAYELDPLIVAICPVAGGENGVRDNAPGVPFGAIMINSFYDPVVRYPRGNLAFNEYADLIGADAAIDSVWMYDGEVLRESRTTPDGIEIILITYYSRWPGEPYRSTHVWPHDVPFHVEPALEMWPYFLRFRR